MADSATKERRDKTHEATRNPPDIEYRIFECAIIKEEVRTMP
jgi:hypothetical protein